jgi:ketosteroid isomerase-like protein
MSSPGTDTAGVATTQGCARCAVENTLTSFCRLLDARRWDAAAALFTDDARFTGYTGRLTQGRAEIRSLWERRPPTPGRHVVVDPQVIVTGGTAVASSEIILITSSPDGPKVHAVVRYEDDLVRERRWLIARRVVHVLDKNPAVGT